MKSSQKKYNLNDLLTVSAVAGSVSRSVDTVRRWHATKKLVPEVIDTRGAKSTRYYTRKQIEDFKRSMERDK